MVQCHSCGKPNADDARFCFSCGSSLVGTPPVKVEVKSPLAGYPPTQPTVPMIRTPQQLTRAGTCYYHPELPSMFVCSRCGRSVCAGCARQYGALTFCAECFWGLAPKIGYPSGQYQQREQSRLIF